MENSKIGIFDSGSGGLFALYYLLNNVQAREYVYFGDLANVPYGSKSRKEIEDYAVKSALFLKEQGADFIAIACNTATAVARELIKEVVSPLPVIDVVFPTVQRALRSPEKNIGVIATTATIRSQVYAKDLLAHHKNVFSQETPELVAIVEKGLALAQQTKTLLINYLKPMIQRKVKLLVLGCTHYDVLKKVIYDIFWELTGEEVTILSSAEALYWALQKEEIVPTFTTLKTAKAIYSRKQSIVYNSRVGIDKITPPKIHLFVSAYKRAFEVFARELLNVNFSEINLVEI